jgi:hypothetical protein
MENDGDPRTFHRHEDIQSLVRHRQHIEETLPIAPFECERHQQSIAVVVIHQENHHWHGLISSYWL